jgi:hypothetical protein
MPEYDFAASVREELDQLRKELTAPGLGDALTELGPRFAADERELLPALWRASKRHGETLTVFAGELRQQFAREAARAGEAGGTPSPEDGSPNTGAPRG